MAQLKLYSRSVWAKAMARARGDYEEKKAGELLNSLEHQVRTLARKGHKVETIARMLGISINTVNKILVE